MSESVPGSKKLDIPEYQVWVVESAHQQMVNDVSDDQDLQIDVSPFIAARSGGKVNTQEQAEVFIGNGRWFMDGAREALG